MIYKCNKCGFLHEGLMPDGYYCPLCRTNFNDFILIEAEEKVYNRVDIDKKNVSINRTLEKCINCGACRNTCENIVGLKNNVNKVCLECGKCILSCPTGAMTPKYDYGEVWELINVPGKTVIVMTSPAVRVGIGDAFNFNPGEFLEGKMIAGLKALGFDYVFDTSFGADLASVEESHELIDRMNNQGRLPMFTSCCPSWVKYRDIFHQKLKANISSCKTPIGMQASVIREIFAKEENVKNEDLIIVALTPCTAKKGEILNTECDYVMTTSELALLIREQNVDFKNLLDEKYDSLFGSSSGTIFGSSGGVMLSVLRCLYYFETGKHLTDDLLLINNKDFYNEYSLKIKGQIIKCAQVSTMINVEKFLPLMNEYVFVEVMNCEGGCLGGGGQVIMPIKDMPDIISKRRNGLMNIDKKAKLKYAYQNPGIIDLYDDFLGVPLSEKSINLLHKH